MQHYGKADWKALYSFSARMCVGVATGVIIYVTYGGDNLLHCDGGDRLYFLLGTCMIIVAFSNA